MRLRDVLKPRMLRRMKEDVETIPAKVGWRNLKPVLTALVSALETKAC
jgi:SNF2 family DNA or RNA helicase